MRVFGWLVRGVFAQARAGGLTAALIAAIAVAGLVSLSLQWRGDELTVGFGWRSLGSGETAARQWLLGLSGVAAGTGGVLLALLWTAGFLPSFLAANAAPILLAKPPSRAVLLLGRYFGVVAYVTLMTAIFIAVTFVAVGTRAGVWVAGYWLAVPVMAVHFAAVYAAVAMIAVSTRSTTACLIGGVLFWLVCWGTNGGRAVVSALPADDAIGGAGVASLAYWLLPKPVDFTLMLARGLGIDLATLPVPHAAKAWESIQPVMTVVSSLAFAVVTLALAVYEFDHADY